MPNAATPAPKYLGEHPQYTDFNLLSREEGSSGAAIVKTNFDDGSIAWGTYDPDGTEILTGTLSTPADYISNTLQTGDARWNYDPATGGDAAGFNVDFWIPASAFTTVGTCTIRVTFIDDNSRKWQSVFLLDVVAAPGAS